MLLSNQSVLTENASKQAYLAQLQSVEAQRVKLCALIDQAEESEFEVWENMETDLDAIFP